MECSVDGKMMWHQNRPTPLHLHMHPQYIEMSFSHSKHSLEIPYKFVGFLFLILKQFNNGTLNVIIMKLSYEDER